MASNKRCNESNSAAAFATAQPIDVAHALINQAQALARVGRNKVENVSMDLGIDTISTFVRPTRTSRPRSSSPAACLVCAPAPCCPLAPPTPLARVECLVCAINILHHNRP